MKEPVTSPTRPPEPLRATLHRIIFGHDTPAGKAFDVALLVAILTSVAAVVLESVDSIRARHGTLLRTFEWILTIGFSIEYALRLYCAPRRWAYVRSFFGVVDLLAVLPSYASFFVPGAHSLLVVRVLRLLRVFRVLKLVRYYGQADVLMSAITRALPKVTVFLGAVLATVVIAGAAMYLIEGPAHGFESIPASMYWAIVTITTVGFGDITPQTPLGRTTASVLMIIGYAIIAVPTGILSSEILRGERGPNRRRCPKCGASDHEKDAHFCRLCGTELDDVAASLNRPG